MNPILVIVVVFIVLLACGGLYDLRHRQLYAARRNLGLEARTARGAAESHGSVGGSDVQGRYGGPGLSYQWPVRPGRRGRAWSSARR